MGCCQRNHRWVRSLNFHESNEVLGYWMRIRGVLVWLCHEAVAAKYTACHSSGNRLLIRETYGPFNSRRLRWPRGLGVSGGRSRIRLPDYRPANPIEGRSRCRTRVNWGRLSRLSWGLSLHTITQNTTCQ